jgi:hypothetical protein
MWPVRIDRISSTRKTLTALEPGNLQLIETFEKRESRVYRMQR